jgi:SMI1/KNR4 family protein SUKH-1
MIEALLGLPAPRLEEPADPSQIEAAERALGVGLPDPYHRLLLVSDGLAVLGGHLRLLGTADLVRWNDPQIWKHAWPDPPTDFVCFGGTSVGDQWAWLSTDLGTNGDAAVTVLDSFELARAPLAPSTTALLKDVLPALATTQVDDLVALAYQRFGSIVKNSLLVAAPPAQFGVQRLVDRMTAMTDADVMTVLGDVARQVNESPGRAVKRFETVMDERGRPRLKLIFD